MLRIYRLPCHSPRTFTHFSKHIQPTFRRAKIQKVSFHTSLVLEKTIRQKTKKKVEGEEGEEETLPYVEQRVRRADEGDNDEEKSAKDLLALKANQEALSESVTPLAKWLRQDQYLPERDRLRDIMDRIRERYPEAAASADKYVSSLSSGYLLQEMQREFPEFHMNRLTDLEVFDFLIQFVPEKERDPSYNHIRDYLKQSEQKEKEKQALLREIDTQEAQATAEHFPSFHQNLGTEDHTGSEAKRVLANDPALLGDTVEASMELFHKIMGPQNPEDPTPVSREKFFEGVDRNDKEAWEMRERMYSKYVEVLRLSRMSESLAERTPEEEPLMEAAISFRQIFRPSSLGKYIRFTQREQKKYLTEGFCGKLEHREFSETKEFSLLFRQPSLTAVNKLKQAEATSFARGCPKPSVLYGEAGVGKSACLQFAVYWARKSNWIVVNIKNATKWAHSGGQITKSKLLPGCWDQPYLGVKFLGHMLDSHGEQLKQIPLRTSFTLGKFDGKNLFDLVEYGAALHEYACDAVVHFRRELERVIEFPVLIAIDDYNSLYNYNQSFRHPESPKFAAPKLKNSQLTLCNIFLDCHINPKLVNGTFIGAVCREVSYRNFPIEQHQNEDWIYVPPYSIYETNKVFEHYKRTEFVLSPTSSGTHGVLHQLNSGRGHDLFRWAKTL